MLFKKAVKGPALLYDLLWDIALRKPRGIMLWAGIIT
jgi:hypothetical protein